VNRQLFNALVSRCPSLFRTCVWKEELRPVSHHEYKEFKNANNLNKYAHFPSTTTIVYEACACQIVDFKKARAVIPLLKSVLYTGRRLPASPRSGVPTLRQRCLEFSVWRGQQALKTAARCFSVMIASIKPNKISVVLQRMLLILLSLPTVLRKTAEHVLTYLM